MLPFDRSAWLMRTENNLTALKGICSRERLSLDPFAFWSFGPIHSRCVRNLCSFQRKLKDVSLGFLALAPALQQCSPQRGFRQWDAARRDWCMWFVLQLLCHSQVFEQEVVSCKCWNVCCIWDYVMVSEFCFCVFCCLWVQKDFSTWTKNLSGLIETTN